MAKPIEYTENVEEKDNTLIPEEYRESFDNLFKTVKSLNDSGLLTLINAVAKNYKYIIESISDQLNSNDTKKAATNIFNVFALLSKIDTDKTYDYMSKLGDSINNAEIKEGGYGITEIVRLMNNKDTAKTIMLFLKILSGLSEEK